MTSESAIRKEEETFRGKHGSLEFEAVAHLNTILRVQVGSGVHGISIEGSDDRDEMGICIPPPGYIYGLLPVSGPVHKFDQYEHHTAWERPGGLRNRSGAGDLDITIYALQKFVRLALNGNPSIVGVFFTPEKDIVKIDYLGRELLALAPLIISKEAGPRYLGYLHAQRRSMESHNGKGRDVTRPELVKQYGFDTKFAGHMVRLGMQGTELLSTGKITLPMPAADAHLIRGIRTGRYTMQECLDMTETLENDLRELMATSDLQEHPDRLAVNGWLVGAHQRHWKEWQIALA